MNNMRLLLLFVVAAVCFIPALCQPSPAPSPQFNLGKNNSELLTSAAAQIPGQQLVLAGSRTNRPDFLHKFRRYQGGWNIHSKHYLASVAFTGIGPVILALLWLACFGVALVANRCYGWKINIKEEVSELLQRISLTLIIVFTCVAVTGCIVVWVGLVESHSEVIRTMAYIRRQSNYAVQTFINATDTLELAKNVSVATIYLPSDKKEGIDKLNAFLRDGADDLQRQTSEKSKMTRRVVNAVYWPVIGFAVAMFHLCLLGLVMSWRGCRHAIQRFIIVGWVLVCVAFLLFGGSLVLNNALQDTCLALEEWADSPNAKNSLISMHPCIDQRATEKNLLLMKTAVNAVAIVVNQYITSIADRDQFPPHSSLIYRYNQSGPLVPVLCYPYDEHLQDRECLSSEIPLGNASMVWQKFICTSASGQCSSPGRLVPLVYEQLVAAVNLAVAVHQYAPPVLSLFNCSFVRTTVRSTRTNYCPPLEYRLRTVTAGLALILVGMMFCVVLWFIYSSFPTVLSLRFRSSRT